WIPEYARAYLEKLNRPYILEDILQIGRDQFSQQNTIYLQKPEFLICDTSFLVLKVWVSVKYKYSNNWLEKHFLEDPVDLYLLCEPDIPWTFDPLREHPDDRYFLFELYENALNAAQKNYHIVRGTAMNQRLESAKQAVTTLS
ncbi:MAG: ATP-binding protein, partial [Bacteroidota bacterium]